MSYNTNQSVIVTVIPQNSEVKNEESEFQKISNSFSNDLPLIPKSNPTIQDTLSSWAGVFTTVLIYILIRILMDSHKTTTLWFGMLLNIVPIIILVPTLGLLFRYETGIWSFIFTTITVMSMYLMMYITPHVELTSVKNAWIVGMLFGGFREELLKMIIYTAPFFASRMRSGCQIMYLALMTGLIFGVIENVDYTRASIAGIQKSNLGTSTEQALRMAVSVRLFNTSLLHASLTFLGSIFIVYSYTGIVKKIPKWAMYIFALIVSSLFHGLYDVALMLSSANVVGRIFWADVVAITYMLITILMLIPIVRVIRPRMPAFDSNVLVVV